MEKRKTVITISGPSGSGKSAFAQCLVGVLRTFEPGFEIVNNDPDAFRPRSMESMALALASIAKKVSVRIEVVRDAPPPEEEAKPAEEAAAAPTVEA